MNSLLRLTEKRKIEDVAAEFWAKVGEPNENGCRLWLGAKWDGNGYGFVLIYTKPRRKVLAHRASWELTYGPIPDGLFCLHKCDVTTCVNPDHLFLGTNSDNIKDAIVKGRMSIEERHLKAKLTREQVLEIRKRYAIGDVTAVSLAEEFSVDHSVIHSIVMGETWKSVGGPRSTTNRSLGELSNFSKLTEEQVVEIRRLGRETNLSRTDIGLQFGLDRSTVNRIIWRRTWKHVP